jgi:hypothetical protein
LMERNLLTNFAPSSWLDRESAELLAKTLFEFIRHSTDTQYHTARFDFLTVEHWGGYVAPETAGAFLREIQRRGLASDSVDENGLVRMHPDVRLLVLLAFVKVLETCVRRTGEVRLQPTTNDYRFISEYLRNLQDYLGVYDEFDRHSPVNFGIRSAGRRDSIRWTAGVIGRDLCTVGVDLSSVPLDELLDFRREQGQHYRAYARSLRRFLADTEFQGDDERRAAIAERRMEIMDMAADLRSRGRKAFGRDNIVTALSLFGAAWTALHGDPIGAALAAASAAVGIKGQEISVSSYSYLFEMQNLPGART